MARIHNFSAGPAVLPESVIAQLKDQLLEYGDSGIGLMEMSHRSAEFSALMDTAQARVRRVLGVSDAHQVLFLQNGASGQFLSVPNNLLQGGAADYLDTGTWSKKAIKEAKRFGQVNVPFSAAESGYDRVPASWEATPGAVYTHYTSNNTVAGTQYADIPTEYSGLLVCDASSDIASRPLDYSKIDVLYAGAQKNLGPSGVTLVVLSPEAVERAAASDAPTMLAWQTHIKAKKQLFNTPNTLGIYVLERVLAWVEEQGLEAIGQTNARKAGALYGLLDSSDFWKPHAQQGSRSLMNVTWRLADQSLEGTLVAQAEAAGFSGIKGHRSVGGLRASIYNACPEESVTALVDFLRDFERSHG
ncbi:MAG: 3-phosphoserine/phosphohydroxythreonine transaminase [Myxococcota bacterium]|nr:3-phosphoserine/phosphohydroxythreonine transaminase [Myxococcota bacterium]